MTPTPPVGSPPRSGGASREGSAERVPSPWSRRWLVIAIGIAAAALAYGIGRFQGAVALTEADRRDALDRQAWKARLAQCETKRDLLTARRSLALVALALDRRNFGVAESHRRDALQALERPSLTSVAAVTELAAKIRGLDLAVDPDPGSKREQVIAVSEVLDHLVEGRDDEIPVPDAGARTPP